MTFPSSDKPRPWGFACDSLSDSDKNGHKMKSIICFTMVLTLATKIPVLLGVVNQGLSACCHLAEGRAYNGYLLHDGPRLANQNSSPNRGRKSRTVCHVAMLPRAELINGVNAVFVKLGPY